MLPLNDKKTRMKTEKYDIGYILYGPALFYLVIDSQVISKMAKDFCHSIQRHHLYCFLIGVLVVDDELDLIMTTFNI